MADEAIETEKAALRVTALARRAALPTDARAAAAIAAAEHFFSAFSLVPGAIVAGYWPIAEELDCRPILTRLMDSGQPVCLPVVMGEAEPLQLRLWGEGEALYPSGYGTLAPADGAPLVEPAFLLIPLVGFDSVGTRLGYGGGYYDRTLAALSNSPRLIGFAYADQELEHIPREAHDVPLDAIVTENGVRRFAADASA